MDDKKINIYKPLCVVLAGATAFSLKGNYDNTKQISSLKADVSSLSEDYSELETEYDSLLEEAEAETVYAAPSSSSYNYNSVHEDATDSTHIAYVYRVMGDTEVYHTDRNCYHIRDKADSALIAFPLDEAKESGLRKCSHCKPLY